MEEKALAAIEAGERFPYRKNLEALAKPFDRSVDVLLWGLPSTSRARLPSPTPRVGARSGPRRRQLRSERHRDDERRRGDWGGAGECHAGSSGPNRHRDE